LALASLPAQARDPLAPYAAPIEAQAGSVDDYYAAHPEPLWLDGDGRAAKALFDLFESADADGLAPSVYATGELRDLIRDAHEGDAEARGLADRALSQRLVDYVTALRTGADARAGWEIADPRVAPHAPSGLSLLAAAAAASDRAEWVEAMPWMAPGYTELRAALTRESDPARAERLRVNLERMRLLPATATGRYVLVNAAAQRLYMVENGRVVDSMKVVVGKADQPTPMLASIIDHADLNPYWNLPVDLVAERVAPNVVKDGVGYLERQGYEVLSGFDAAAAPVDPSTIDWNEAAANKLQLRMRQRPGPYNAMGVMKFGFANAHGVFLHDTPSKELLLNDVRLNSAGCVRLEDAPRLGRWLFGRSLKADGAAPEQRVELERPVPIYLAYLTATPDEHGELTFYDDIYHRDSTVLATR
jgi:murein L,D-transpeptidase YcbB/YkuD